MSAANCFVRCEIRHTFYVIFRAIGREGGTGVRACTTGEGTEGRNNGKGGTGAPDKAIEIRTRRGRGLCYIEKLHRSDSRPDSCFLSFFHFDERLLEPFRRTVSLPCLFTRWLEGEGRELIVGVGFIYFFFPPVFLGSFWKYWNKRERSIETLHSLHSTRIK